MHEIEWLIRQLIKDWNILKVFKTKRQANFKVLRMFERKQASHWNSFSEMIRCRLDFWAKQNQNKLNKNRLNRYIF